MPLARSPSEELDDEKLEPGGPRSVERWTFTCAAIRACASKASLRSDEGLLGKEKDAGQEIKRIRCLKLTNQLTNILGED